MTAIRVHDLGVVPYPDAHSVMLALVDDVAAGRQPDTLLIAAHPPVITVGRKRNAPDNVLDARDIPVVPVERGGDVTYHGPGQIVLYPIIKLRGARRDLHRVLRDLEEVVIRALGDFGIPARREPGLTGVWAQDRKLASIGIAVRDWVVYHGVALNLAPDPGFSAIRACGLDSAVIASVEDLTGAPADRESVKGRLIAAFDAVFAG
jgi:lipoate-protein ligase B